MHRLATEHACDNEFCAGARPYTTPGGNLLYDAVALANIYLRIEFELCRSYRFRDSRGPQKWGGGIPWLGVTPGGRKLYH